MTDTSQKQQGNTLWNIATHCAGRRMRKNFITTVIQMPEASKRLLRLTTDCPDLLTIIKQEGKV